MFELIPATISAAISEQLSEIEQSRDVRVLYACESGSRAWGFPSADSDFDARFIYVHPRDWYLSVFERRDVIELPIEELAGSVYDVNGWDLRKVLRLLAKSNPVLLEWLRSPLRYRVDEAFHAELLDLAARHFSLKAGHYHYFHMARKNFNEHLRGEQVKLKKYFYVLRPVLACQWIERERSAPPMTLVELLDELLPSGLLRDEILHLRERKMSGDELGEAEPNPAIQAFLVSEIERLTALLPASGPVPASHPELDAFLKRWAQL